MKAPDVGIERSLLATSLLLVWTTRLGPRKEVSASRRPGSSAVVVCYLQDLESQSNKIVCCSTIPVQLPVWEGVAIQLPRGSSAVFDTSDPSTMTAAAAKEISMSDALTDLPTEKKPTISADAVAEDARSMPSSRSEGGRSATVPFKLKLLSVVIVSLIGFGSHWSSGVTGAMKSTLK